MIPLAELDRSKVVDVDFGRYSSFKIKIITGREGFKTNHFPNADCNTNLSAR
jgi:hypothetical protein